MRETKAAIKRPPIHSKRSSVSYSLIDLVTHHVLDNINDSVYWINADGYFKFMNKTMRERRGISPERYQDTHYLDLVGPEYHAQAREHFKRVMSGENEVLSEVRYKDVHGQARIVEVHSKPVREGGEVAGLLGISRDITRHKELEETIQKSEKRYRSLLENASDAILLADMNGNLLDVNRKAEQLLGYSKPELLCMNVSDIHTKEQTDRIRDTFQEIIQNGFAMIHNTLALRKDGAAVPIEITGSRVEHDGETVFQGIFRDLTERKQAEKQSWLNQEQLRLALHAGEHGLVDWDVPNDRLRFSDQLLELTGYSKDEFEPRMRSWKKRVHPKEKSDVVRSLRDHLDGKTGHFDATYRLRVKTGVWRWFRGHAEVVERDERGRPLRMMGTITDVTLYKEFEEELEKRVEERTAELVDVNSALKVLLRQREQDKADAEETIAANLKFMLLPHWNRLKRSGLNGRQKELVSLIDESLTKVFSPFIRKLSSRYSSLTPRELQVAERIQSGKTTKDIAEEMNISAGTVDVLRYSVRKKLGLNRKKANLQSHLSSI